VDAALNTDRETGELAQYNLRYLKSRVSKNAVIVFSDTTTESATMKNLMCGCGLIFLAAMLVFLGISIRLSGWAVKPVAKAWEQQRQFVADASHELKTPLSVIMANAELLQTAEPEEQKNFSQNILTMTYQMRTLVENMLEMARVDNETLNMRLEQVDFSQLVCDAVLSFQLLYEDKEMGLDSNIGEHIQLRGSEQHLYQVLDVLLDNALKYSAPKSTVCVELTQSGRCCVLTVRSPGEPIPKEELKKIFKRFYRADKARAMNGSYGLGLSIAEAVVDAHKGKIWAENYEGGNAFSVQLPMNGQTGR
jgi:signal transduction histidine kinase